METGLPSSTLATTASRPDGTSMVILVSGSSGATTPLSMAQVASAMVPWPQAVEKPALWKNRTPRSPSASSGPVTKQPYMSAWPLGS